MNSKTNLNLLYTLQVLLAERHVSRAATRLNLTQSAVSRQLSQLRDIYQDPLLVREGSHYVLTPRALKLSRELEPLLENIHRVLGSDEFDPKLYQQTLTFSSSDYVAQYIFPELVGRIAEYAPLMDFSYRLWEPNLLQQLGDSDVQLASTMLPEAPVGLSSRKIGEDLPVIVMRKQHPLSNHPELSFEDLERYPHIRISAGGDKDSFLDRTMKERGLKRRILVSTPFFSSAFAMLQQSDGLLTLPQHIAVNLAQSLGLRSFSLPFTPPTHLYWLIWHPKYDQDPAHTWLREQVLTHMRTSMYSVRD
ncbi:LysR family transcriptional regulator [Vibrio sp. 10N]|uniref:LysR family transcriptional regulator n=1 Tax=Vibrio sp. 10N TaxID=3058938 RepID=UPI002812915B|nr:LysR family transcriptional regulator [Vibrio sp. 10N]